MSILLGSFEAGPVPSRKGLLAASLFLALLLVATGCQSSDSDDGDLSFDATDSSVDTDTEDQNEDEADVTSTTTEASSTADTDTDEPSTDEPSATTLTTVRIDEGDAGEFIDQQLVDDKVAEAALAAADNWFRCVMDPESCDFDRDVSPSVSGSFEQFLRTGLPSIYLETGARYRPGPVDIREVVEVVASNEVPVIAQVTLCQVDTGEVYIPAADGSGEEIVNDDVAGLLVTYVVIQNEDGVLTVNDRLVGEQRADQTFCDEYL